MASEDFPLVDASSHLHETTHHARNEADDGDYFPQPYPGVSDPNSGSSLGATTATKATPNCYKKLKSSSSTANNGCHNNETESSSCAEMSRADYRKDREEWSDTAITCLLEAYTEKYNQLNRGNLRGKDWEEVAETVSERCAGAGSGSCGGEDKHGSNNKSTYKSVEQCKNKIDNLKKRYKVEIQRMSNGGQTVSHWHWFKQIEAIVGNSGAIKSASDEERGSGGNSAVAKQSKRYMCSNSVLANSVKTKPVLNLKWNRVVFKISDGALSGDCQSRDVEMMMHVAREVATACRLGVEVAIVVGGRNFFCGGTWNSATGLDRSTTFQISMMATVMNSLLLQSALEKLGIQARIQTAFTMPEVSEPYNRRRAIRHLEKGRVVIFGGTDASTGNYLLNTDIVAALRASELNAGAVLKGTNVGGIYGCHSGNNSVNFEHLCYREVISRGSSFMDIMAITFCEENAIPVVIFDLQEPGNISRAVCGGQVGTLIDRVGRMV